MIRVLNLDFEYEPDNGLVLCDVNIDIKHNEIIAILGPNGSGKTTLIKHFNALLAPLSGEIHVDGLDTREKRNHKKIRETVSFVFQNPLDQFIGFTVFEDIAVPMRMKGIKENDIKEKANAVLEEFGLQAYVNRYPHTLSGGQQKLLSIAASLVLDPKIVVLDEPTVMLDKGRKELIHKHIKKINEQNKTIVISTTDPEEASFADRIYVIHEGKIVANGKPKDVFNDKNMLNEIGIGVPNNV